MRLPANLKLDLSVAAALAGFGLLTAAGRRPAPPQVQRRPATPAESLAALREELNPDPNTTGRGAKRQGVDAAHGRDAATPSQIPARGWWDIAKRVYQQISDHRIMTEAAGITYYALLAIFPGLGALISLYGLFADPHTVGEQMNALSGVIPGGGMQIINDQVKSLIEAPSGALGIGAIIGLLVALWSANGGTKAMFDSLNIVYDEKEKRSFLHRTLLSLAMTLGALLFLILAMGAVVVLPIVLNFVGLGRFSEVLLRLARWPLLLVGVAALLAAIYRYGPSRDTARWRWVSWGGGFAAVLWVLVSIAFSWYVSNFGSYNKTYGSLGAAVGFMTWIWISSIVVLIGAELDAEMEHQTRHDTTVGPEKPLGARGATKADTVAPVT